MTTGPQSTIQEASFLGDASYRPRSLRLGRDQNNDVVLEDWRVSRNHAVLSPTSDGYEVVDLNSTNGTYVEGAPVRGKQHVAFGGSIRIEPFILFLEPTGIRYALDPTPPIVMASADDVTPLVPASRGDWGAVQAGTVGGGVPERDLPPEPLPARSGADRSRMDHRLDRQGAGPLRQRRAHVFTYVIAALTVAAAVAVALISTAGIGTTIIALVGSAGVVVVGLAASHVAMRDERQNSHTV